MPAEFDRQLPGTYNAPRDSLESIGASSSARTMAWCWLRRSMSTSKGWQRLGQAREEHSSWLAQQELEVRESNRGFEWRKQTGCAYQCRLLPVGARCAIPEFADASPASRASASISSVKSGIRVRMVSRAATRAFVGITFQACMQSYLRKCCRQSAQPHPDSRAGCAYRCRLR